MIKAIAVGLLAVVLVACNRQTSAPNNLELGVYADRRVALLAEPTLDAATATKTLIRGQVRIDDPKTSSRYLLVDIYGECDRQNPRQSFLGLERVNEVDDLLQQRTPRAGLGTAISLADQQRPVWVSDLMRRYCPAEALP
ncbi:hypothetical protein [Synechococcus elongatus]|uniref:Lipoprotein n=2 Tax=Synechococcus elongatus TaxID=32046 RepID=Q31NE4_SYNE7|nr:hypothetical protein [Synechococcus elongatus]MBD2689608.1 hypothetical protein [Synechococcus elongatus FACHB-1061]ABB57425.1 conserved hypothetical protein [Synechococcus elongatus PCC 7942 = FACHB-805]AJD58071.1 hypothetical protein M744_09620 [Synechococcus elongatus UTEX 2973]MBD2588540.1 hypothetical protein [Synechococcus elongatus FACHB-242]MBD2707973.1 hypothetical protein [Synechococcus elongatus PCC 7942 = FACHB-805]